MGTGGGRARGHGGGRGHVRGRVGRGRSRSGVLLERGRLLVGSGSRAGLALVARALGRLLVEGREGAGGEGRGSAQKGGSEDSLGVHFDWS